jgi:drug/metabolite transporter (DMT)-like permease
MTTAVAPRQRLLAHLAMLAFSALIAGSFTTGALAVPYIHPIPLNAVRFLLAAIVMGAAAFGVARYRFAFPPAPWRFAVMGALMAVYFVTMFIALTMTLPVATSAVYTLVPLMTAVTAWFIVRQRSSAVVILSLVIAGLGSIWVIFRGDIQALLSFDVGKGELIYFIGCAAYAFYTPLLRRYSRGEPSMVQSFWTLSATAVWIALSGIPDILATDWLHLPPVVWWVVLYLAVGPTAICFFLIQFASLRLPAPKVIAYGYLTPAFVIAFEAIAGHGLPTPPIIVGAAVTVLGLVLLAVVKD